MTTLNFSSYLNFCKQVDGPEIESGSVEGPKPELPDIC